ncbi:MAG: hypothetical protein ACLUVV_06795 [Christensenellales bacterium]
MSQKVREVFEQGQGIFRMMPNFVPRCFSKPGHRLRLHPDDYFALGMKRGAMKERWFSSTIVANNGPYAAEDEGLSYIALNQDGSEKVALRDAIQELGAEIIGQELMDTYGGWPMYSKFFDNNVPLFHHLHLDNEAAARVGRLGKPEAYYFPPQLNNHLGEFPATYFGFDPDVKKEEVRACLECFEDRDNRITELSRAYRIELGTGWYTPAGVVHAPGSVLTYEPQWNSDVNSVYENVTADEVNSITSLNENCPDDKKDDIDYIMSLMDWDANVDPHYRKKYFRPPVETDAPEGAIEKWVDTTRGYAKELTVLLGQTVTIKDAAAYGCITVQATAPLARTTAKHIMLRYGQMSADELCFGKGRQRRRCHLQPQQGGAAGHPKDFAPNNKEILQKSPLWED